MELIAIHNTYTSSTLKGKRTQRHHGLKKMLYSRSINVMDVAGFNARSMDRCNICFL